MDNGLLFHKLAFNNKFVKDYELVFKDKFDNTRLYVLKELETHSFYAQALQFNSCPVTDKKINVWDNEELLIDILFTVVAYSDGVRHLEFNRIGTEHDGYLYYPPMKSLILMLQKVREIELEICPHADKD